MCLVLHQPLAQTEAKFRGLKPITLNRPVRRPSSIAAAASRTAAEAVMQRAGTRPAMATPGFRDPTRRNGGGPAPVHPNTKKRWLATEYYAEAREGFNTYNPEEWMPTLKFKFSSFMFPPWFAIFLFCVGGTVYIEMYASDEIKAWVQMPLDAHTVLGSALSFLIVMRTDNSCVCRRHHRTDARACPPHCVLACAAAPHLRRRRARRAS